MKTFIQNLYKMLFAEDLVQKPSIVVQVPIEKPLSNREKLLKIALEAYRTDPTPKDEVPDEVSCVFSLTTLIKRFLPDFPIMDYTPTFLKYIQTDKRFRTSTEFKEGNIVISVTNTGNGKIMGHIGICGKEGKILSNSSETGLWYDKYDNLSWIKRYSQTGQLDMYIFELL